MNRKKSSLLQIVRQRIMEENNVRFINTIWIYPE